MLTGILIGALSAAGLVQQTDTIVQANGASRLVLESFQGEVVVRTWDRDAVQIRADHDDSFVVDISRSGSAISVEPDLERGFDYSNPVNFHLTVPRAFDLDIEGVAVSVDIQGTEGEVQVTTVHGPVSVQGGRGSIVLESVNGAVHLEGAQGDVEVTGIAGGVEIRNCSGDISADAVGGNITLEGITSSDVEIGTVGGTLRYEGTIQDGGSYSFGTHAGEVWLFLPPNVNASVEALAMAGDIQIDYPGAPSAASSGGGIPGLHGKELSFELGTGSAQIEVETFAGTVHILSAGGR